MEPHDVSSLTKNEIKSWLKIVPDNQHLVNYDIEIIGHPEPGSGIVGDVIFIRLTGTTDTGAQKTFEIVLKRSKVDRTVRKNLPVFESFHNEIHMYQNVFPAFTKFCEERGINDALDYIPKCFGIIETENEQIVLLENLKPSGFDMWDRMKLMEIELIHNVIECYAKFHAISLAMADQEPGKFCQLANELISIWGKLNEKGHMEDLHRSVLRETCDFLEGDISASDMQKWRNLERADIFQGLLEDSECAKVIAHSDCWNNNFLFKFEGEGYKGCKSVILDFQMCLLASPILDVSYFIFCCARNEDFAKIDNILSKYYTVLSQLVTKMGSDPEKLYSFEQFKTEWRKFAKFGIGLSLVGFKLSRSSRENITDQLKEEGKHVTELFKIELDDITEFKKRVLHILECALESQII